MEDVFDRFLSYIKEARLRQIGIDAVVVTHKEGENNEPEKRKTTPPG